MVPDVLSRTQENIAPSEMLTVVEATKTKAFSVHCPVNLTQIAAAQQKDIEIHKLIGKTSSQMDHDPSQVHYSLENGIMFRSVPDGQKGLKL